MARALHGIALLALLVSSKSVGAQGILYEEDFDDGVADGFVFTDDPWSVENGYLQCLRAGFAISSMGYVPASSWSDYIYEVDLRVFGSINQKVAFRIQSQGDFYEVNVRADPYNDAHLHKYFSGQMTTLAVTEVSTHSEEWHHYTISVSGTHIDIRFDSTPLFSYVDDANPYLWGGIGVVCFTGGVIQWQRLNADNVRVTVPSVPVGGASWSRIKGLYR